MFKNIWGWIVRTFQDLALFLEKPAAVAVQIVNVIKDYVGNPMVDVFTQLTRTGIDDSIVALVRKYLPSSLGLILKAENIIKDLTKGDFSTLLKAFAEYIRSIAPEARGRWWRELAAIVLQIISKRPVTTPMAFVMTQGIYLRGAAA